MSMENSAAVGTELTGYVLAVLWQHYCCNFSIQVVELHPET